MEDQREDRSRGEERGDLWLTFACEALDVEVLVLNFQHFSRAVPSARVTGDGWEEGTEKRTTL